MSSHSSNCNSTTSDELRVAVLQLQERGLHRSATWAAELLLCVQTDAKVLQQLATKFRTGSAAANPLSTVPPVALASAGSNDLYLVAIGYFSQREFARAAYLLAPIVTASLGASSGAKPQREFFLWAYASYLDAERLAVGTAHERGLASNATEGVSGPSAWSGALEELLQQLAECNVAGSLDAFGLYLYGVLLRKRTQGAAALEILLQSVVAFPLNWSAWLDLASVVEDAATLEKLRPRLPQHWMSSFFLAHALVEHQDNTAALEVYEGLSALFPTSPYLQAQVGTAMYNLRQFPEAQTLFERVRAQDPHRIEDADTYSNILYVQDAKSALSTLARDCMSLDRFRPETCCVVGNYYSLRGEHQKAIIYFRRALRLNQRHLSAWTLMGHEFVELKNTPAAIECYRCAVNTNPRDYRAWYGLGQTYELLQMYMYSSYYYRRATSLRPYDGRMWSALGAVYEALDRREDAIACYLRAAAVAGRDSMADLRLARLFRREQDVDAACTHYAAYVEEREARGEATGVGAAAAADLAEALLFLAKTALDEGHTAAASVYAGRVLPMPLAHEVEAARALLAKIRAVSEAEEDRGLQEAESEAHTMSSSAGSVAFLGSSGTMLNASSGSGLAARSARQQRQTPNSVSFDGEAGDLGELPALSSPPAAVRNDERSFASSAGAGGPVGDEEEEEDECEGTDDMALDASS